METEVAQIARRNSVELGCGKAVASADGGVVGRAFSQSGWLGLRGAPTPSLAVAETDLTARVKTWTSDPQRLTGAASWLA